MAIGMRQTANGYRLTANGYRLTANGILKRRIQKNTGIKQPVNHIGNSGG